MKILKLDRAQLMLLYGYPEDALKFLDDSLAHRFLRAIAHRHLGDVEIARMLVSQLLSNPGDLPVHSLWNTYGMIKTDLGRFEDALFCFQQAFEILAATENPPICSYDGNAGGPQISLNLAYALMRLGRFAEAWPLWESARHGWSWQTPLVPWTGELGRVLVVPEGGVGDQILFSRWLAEAEDTGAELTYYLHEELFPILPTTSIRHHPRLIPKPRSVSVSTDPYPNIDWDKFDFATSVMSLPAICGMKSISDIPTDTWEPYRKSQSGLAGLCWAAEETGAQRKTRSIPIQEFEPLYEKYSWVSLCPGRAHPDRIMKFRPETWADTAGMLREIDFLVTCDTAVAHLAGAMNIPTYVILPLASDWKYFTRELAGDQSPWYPWVKLIRNTDPVSFKPAIELLLEELKRDGRI